MEVRQVTSLANLLRDSGDKILSSESKLTLSGSLLKGLNDSFSLITHESDNASANGFQVVKPLITKSDVLQDLQLIYDFVQKTLSLCIMNYPGEENFKDTVDLNRFRSLVKLEIQKFNINQIVGIQKFRPHLQQLICVRCLNNVDDIIIYCGKDNSMGFVWNELRVADFSYNNLKKCDNSLEFAAYLQNLNLSHNNLTSVEAVKWLPHLKILNLSFNRLNSIPIFHIEANRKLQILIINNNLIEVINSFKLEALINLDLSNNCLLDHSNLLSLSTFCALRSLNLSGNPLSCHPKHRENTSKYLHKNTSRENFILDSEPLSKYEKSLTGKIKSFNPLYATRSFSQINKTSGSSTPIRRSERFGDSSCGSSVESFKIDFINRIKIPESTKKDRIIDLDSSSNKDQIEENKTYLETKQKIEQLRKEYGPRWLQEQSSKEMVESVLGLESTKNDDSKTKITPEDLINELLPSINIPKNGNDLNNILALTSTPVNDNPFLDFEDETTNNVEITNVSEENFQSDDLKSSETIYESANDSSTSNVENITTTTYESLHEQTVPKVDQLHLSNEEEPFSEPEDGEDFFTAYVNDSSNEICLTVSETRIRERDALTKRTLTKWSLAMLESCDRIKSDTLRINFDTIKEDKRERLYKILENSCQVLEKKLRVILSKRQLSEMNQTIYRCVQCLSQFSMEKSNDYKELNLAIQCPICQSKFVAEVNETPNTMPTNESQTLKTSASSTSLDLDLLNIVTKSVKQGSLIRSIKGLQLASDKNTALQQQQDQQQMSAQISQGEKNVLEESASHSSIGSAGSLNESSSCSKISQNSFDSNQSVAGSSSNERDNDFNNMGIGNSKYYNDSDVEILSNPSQSSIEVLDGFQSSRKTSSEERRISRIPSLETIEDSSITNFSFKIGEDITSADFISDCMGILNDNNKTITSEDSSAEFLKREIKNSLAVQQQKQEQQNNDKYVKATTESDDKINKPNKGIVEKKPTIGHFNLTESSSSGSVTDSICTTYEQQNESTNDLTIGGENKDDENKNEKDLSFMSNILGGLFQSTNKLMSRSQKSLDSESSNLCEKFKYNYNDFNDIDHRLKFYFMLNKFNNSKEYFKCLVKGKIFDGNTLRYFEAILVISTYKLYIMEIFGLETDDPTKWLKEILSVSIDRLETLQLLPFKIGLSITITNFGGKFLFILPDILLTDSLMLFFANNSCLIPDNCNIEYQVSEIVMTKILSLTKNNKIKMFAILNSCENKISEKVEIISPCGFYITDDYLYLTNSNLSFLSENLNENIDLSSTQKMSNLVEVKKSEENNILEIYFTDEGFDRHDIWKCEFGTQENAEIFLNAIEQSWEKIFGVPLINNLNN